MSQSYINVIGAGLAGSEAAYQIAKRGIPVKLYEMRGMKSLPQHKTSDFAELVCSNSLRGRFTDKRGWSAKRRNAPFDSIIMRAEATRVPAGGALAVDERELFKSVTDELNNHPFIEVIREEITEIP